ncbi:MAG: 4-hydroxyphenylpyruvate dioxygenase [Myxococcales bacterium]|nr:MAG: 4-hydroxyphenylpyruvate dioxygenase [Myxococcales bacterium]
MPQVEPLGILGVEGVHYYVRDLERSRRFYVDRLDFQEIGASGPELTRAGRQRSVAFQSGSYVVICSTPEGAGGRAARFLSRHPDGIGTVAFQVEDAERTFALLEQRGGTPIGEIERFQDEHGTLKTFSITTPFGDTTFRFIERRGFRPILPGYEMSGAERGAPGATGVQRVDHVTSNFQTMMPALLWMEYVLGFSRLWDVQFHTRDVARFEVRDGSGLRSVVMWDPRSGIKFANNEPYRPNFKGSQINVFHEEHRGDGIQHLALDVADILSSVRRLRARGVEFMRTPPAYYDALPARLESLGIGALEEDLQELRELEVLVDGHGHGSYLLQIFLKDSAGLYQDAGAGPFFYELIQRKGDQGFGAGNFRALFESIEREQEVLAEKGG